MDLNSNKFNRLMLNSSLKSFLRSDADGIYADDTRGQSAATRNEIGGQEAGKEKHSQPISCW